MSLQVNETWMRNCRRFAVRNATRAMNAEPGMRRSLSDVYNSVRLVGVRAADWSVGGTSSSCPTYLRSLVKLMGRDELVPPHTHG